MKGVAYMKKKTSKLALTSLGFTLLMNGLVGCSPKEILKLKEETVTKELGETVSLDPKEYLVDDTTQEVLEKTVLDSELLKDEEYVVNEEEKTIVSKDKEFLNVGEYAFTLTYNESENKEVKVVVQDTTAPTFKDFKEEIKIEQNAKDVDFTAYFSCEDLSVCKVKTDSSDVDLSKTGETTLKVSAIDEYENKLEKEVKVTVVSMEEARKEEGVTKTVDGTVFKSEALVKKEEEEKKAEEQKKNQQSNSSSNSNSNSNNGGSIANSGSSNNSSTGQTQQPEEPTTPSQYLPDQSRQIFNLINQERQKAGLNTLTWADDLVDMVNIRSAQLPEEYKNNTVHSGKRVLDPNFNYGEIANGNGYGWGIGNAEYAVSTWMASEGHKNWILNQNNSAMAVSTYYDSETCCTYWITWFIYK